MSVVKDRDESEDYVTGVPRQDRELGGDFHGVAECDDVVPA